MKFVTFEVPTPLGNVSRVGALAQVGDGQVVLDLAHGYAALLQEEARNLDFVNMPTSGFPRICANSWRAVRHPWTPPGRRRGSSSRIPPDAGRMGSSSPSPFLKRGCAPGAAARYVS